MADSAPRNFTDMPIDSPMHHTQASCPGRMALPPCCRPLGPWHGGVAMRSPRLVPVFGTIAIKWYSETAKARVILVGGSSRRQWGMVLSAAGAPAAGNGYRGPLCPPEPGLTRGGNDGM